MTKKRKKKGKAKNAVETKRKILAKNTGKRKTIFVTKTVRKEKNSSFEHISTDELKKMQAFGVLPFEMRKELEKRTKQ